MSSRLLVLRADQLIDGKGGAPVRAGEIVIDGDRILHAGASNGAALPEGARLLEFSGATILPGLIDTHVHLNLPGDGTLLEDAVREPEGVLVATSAFNAARALAAGITTVRDVGGMGNSVAHLRRALQLGHGRGAHVLCCGQPITITGGHTWYFGGEADGEERLRRKVRDLIKHGADFIKVMASGGGTVNTMPWLPAFSRGELGAIADEAHRQGRKVAAHCLCAAATRDAIAVGVDQIEHAGFICDAAGNQRFEADVAEDLARSEIPVTGTLAVGGAVIARLRALEARSAAQEALLERWQTMLEENLDQFGRLRAAGVRFVAGTDAGWRYTRVDDLPMELSLMNRGGLSPMEAIVAATGRAAAVIGIGGDRGTLEAGKRADAVVVGGNPLDDLAVLSAPRMVVQDGIAMTPAVFH
ncbi:amidohydrolase family protein [Breoghania sp. JC706]|uniref:amidohydrolase family protein n=1 Tax=Breoghania sp. JC706 TaxID=3117732 RepID=UPI00300A9D9A